MNMHYKNNHTCWKRTPNEVWIICVFNKYNSKYVLMLETAISYFVVVDWDDVVFLLQYAFIVCVMSNFW